MKVLCWDNAECNHLLVLDVCAAYYDEDVAGLVLAPSSSSFDDFCFPDMHFDCCNGIIFELYRYDFCDLRNYGEVQMYSDIV